MPLVKATESNTFRYTVHRDHVEILVEERDRTALIRVTNTWSPIPESELDSAFSTGCSEGSMPAGARARDWT